MTKIEKILLIGLSLVLSLGGLIFGLSICFSGLNLKLLLLAVGLVIILFWAWYFGVCLKDFWGWRQLLLGFLVSVILWLSTRVLWSILGYGVWAGWNFDSCLLITGVYFVYSFLSLIVFGGWLRLELDKVSDLAGRNKIIVSVFSAVVVLFLIDVSLSGWIVLILLWILAYSLGDIFGRSIIWPVVVFYLMINLFIDYYLADYGLLVVGMPGPWLIEIFVLVTSLMILQRYDRRIKK